MQRNATQACTRSILTHAIAGWIVSLAIAALLLVMDVGSLRTLMLESSAPEVAFICFLLTSTTTFTALVFATGLVISARAEDGD